MKREISFMKWDTPCIVKSPSFNTKCLTLQPHPFLPSISLAIVSRTKYQNLSGTRCKLDFVEVPSILMELFYESPIIQELFYQASGSTVKFDRDKYLQWLGQQSNLPTLSKIAQIHLAMADQMLHMDSPTTVPLENNQINCPTTAIFRRAHELAHVLPFPVGTSWQGRFTHLAAYGAGYYTYLVCRNIAERIWQRYFATNPLNPIEGHRLLDTILIHGGAKDPQTLFAAYRILDDVD